MAGWVESNTSQWIGSNTSQWVESDYPRITLIATLFLRFGLEFGSTLIIVNSLNVVVESTLTCLNDVLIELSGTQRFKYEIEELAQVKDTLSLVNHILNIDSEDNEYYFSRSHGM